MRLDSYNKRQIEKQAAKFFIRLQHTNPFPTIVDDVVPGVSDPIYNTYMYCLPERVCNAILVLTSSKGYRGVLNENSSSSLSVDIPYPTSADSVKHIADSIRFNFSTIFPANPYYDSTAKLDPEHPMYDKIAQWALKAKKVRDDYNRCIYFIETIVTYANTVGQLRTMFPDYAHLLPGHQQDHISKMQKRSRLPKDIDMSYVIAHRQFVAEKTALCLLLPEGGEKIWIE